MATEDSPGRVRERAQGEPQQCHCRSGQRGDYGIFTPPGNRVAAAGSESPLGLANRQALISPLSLQWGRFGLGACPAPRSLRERLGRCFLEHQRPASTLATCDYLILHYYKFSSSVTPATFQVLHSHTWPVAIALESTEQEVTTTAERSTGQR